MSINTKKQQKTKVIRENVVDLYISKALSSITRTWYGLLCNNWQTERKVRSWRSENTRETRQIWLEREIISNHGQTETIESKSGWFFFFFSEFKSQAWEWGGRVGGEWSGGGAACGSAKESVIISSISDKGSVINTDLVSGSLLASPCAACDVALAWRTIH